ncbi:extracellular solute-binding protein [Halomicroarcula limicola]|uniref:Extracellular solute-binding protein n=1 Tax=Haloarcula limicola TaxID=1429915 RepID=A0A8J7Y4M3_9EURY|nr:extracellular solute-binding protein [Halomicroarcula limicola]MBV0924137.1 extracellular solute-binding protein [Halomicroarcula limicola]
MTMDRRTLIKQLGGIGAATAIAGCSVQEDGGDGGGDGGDGGSGGTDSDGSSGTESQGPAGTATAWYSLSESELATRQDIIKEFNEQKRHTIEGADISDLQQKTSSAIPAGEGPQIFDWAHDWAGNTYEQGFIVGQGDQLSVDMNVYTETARQAAKYDGKVIGLPYGAETVTPIVNTDIVDSVPSSVDEMISTIEKHHDPDNGQYGLSYPINSYFTSGWLQAFGGYFFKADSDPQLGIAEDEFVRGLEFIVENFKPYMPKDPKYSPQAAAFNEGNAAITINGPWSLAALNGNDLNYEVIPFPEMSEGTPNPYTGIQLWYFAKAMESGGPSAAAARTFAEWYTTNEDHIRSLAENQGSIPVLKSVAQGDDLPATVQAFSSSVDMGTPMPAHPKMDDVWGPVDSALVKAFNGDATPEQALTTAAKDIRSNW